MFHHITHEIDVASLAQDTEVAIIVQQIEHHEREILTLRKRLNRHLPAARIPDDILVEIFFHSFRLIRQSFWEWRTEVNYWDKPACPKELTHWPVILVCQRWRNLVMDNPRLWSFITSCDKPGYAHNALARSANAGLQLRLDKSNICDDSENVFGILLEHLPRAYSLEYRFNSSPWDNKPPSLGPIRSLSLLGIPYGRFEETDPLARYIAAAPLSHLETVYLQDVPNDVCSILPRPMITFLEIKNEATRSGYGRLETNKLIIALADLPLLEVARLQFQSLPKPQCKIPDSQLPDVYLERLRELKLSTQTDACSLLLSHLSFPPQTKVSVTTFGVWEEYTHPSRGSRNWYTRESGCSSLINEIMARLKALQLDHWHTPYHVLLQDGHSYNMEVKHFTVQICSQQGHKLGIRIHNDSLDQAFEHIPLQNIEVIDFSILVRSALAKILGQRQAFTTGVK